MVTAYDHGFADYGLRMFKSFQRFNPTVPMCFADFSRPGWTVGVKTAELERMGVTILKTVESFPTVRHNYWDMMLLPFVDRYEWDALMWIDADTLVLRDLEPAWAFKGIDFTGHPDRRDGQWETRCSVLNDRIVPGDDHPRFASGLWVCRSRRMLADMDAWVKEAKPLRGRDSDAITAIVNGHYTWKQLDGPQFNFGRELIPQAELYRRRIRYRLDGKVVYPHLAAFSRVPVVPGIRDERMRSDALDKFYREVVCDD
jgi:hypothetical protein